MMGTSSTTKTTTILFCWTAMATRWIPADVHARGAASEFRREPHGVTRPGFQPKVLRSFDAGTANQVQVRAELSATTRDDNLLENAVSLFSAEPKVKAVRWSIQGEAAADWTGSGSG